MRRLPEIDNKVIEDTKISASLLYALISDLHFTADMYIVDDREPIDFLKEQGDIKFNNTEYQDITWPGAIKIVLVHQILQQQKRLN